MNIDSPEALDSLPIGAMVDDDDGRRGAKSPMGGWIDKDGRTWEPRVPVDLVGIPDH